MLSQVEVNELLTPIPVEADSPVSELVNLLRLTRAMSDDNIEEATFDSVEQNIASTIVEMMEGVPKK